MVKNPKIGGVYWVWGEDGGQSAAVPVELTMEELEGMYHGVWKSPQGYSTFYDFLRAKDLYRTPDEVWAEIQLEEGIV